MSDSDRIKPPWWLEPANKIFVAMSRLGMRYGPERPVVLTVRGRKSGKLRSTPITPMVIDGKRYVVEGFPGADWVKNARTSGEVSLARGRHVEHVRVVELLPEEARPVLRAFRVEVLTGVNFMKNAGLVKDGRQEEFEALAGRQGHDGAGIGRPDSATCRCSAQPHFRWRRS
jgi:deazaflavin-dependent oxidoreductase (nitroreductase family)